MRHSWTAPVLVCLGVLVSDAAAPAFACSVELGRGWARGAGAGTITMVKGGKNCGAQMWTVPEARLPVATISVTTPPSNGRLTTKGNAFQYTPAPGFQGQDSFALSGTGRDQTGASVTLTGRVSVTVQ